LFMPKNEEEEMWPTGEECCDEKKKTHSGESGENKKTGDCYNKRESAQKLGEGLYLGAKKSTEKKREGQQKFTGKRKGKR